jgi:hypothetical protein
MPSTSLRVSIPRKRRIHPMPDATCHIRDIGHRPTQPAQQVSIPRRCRIPSDARCDAGRNCHIRAVGDSPPSVETDGCEMPNPLKAGSQVALAINRCHAYATPSFPHSFIRLFVDPFVYSF